MNNKIRVALLLTAATLMISVFLPHHAATILQLGCVNFLLSYLIKSWFI